MFCFRLHNTFFLKCSLSQDLLSKYYDISPSKSNFSLPRVFHMHKVRAGVLQSKEEATLLRTVTTDLMWNEEDSIFVHIFCGLKANVGRLASSL